MEMLSRWARADRCRGRIVDPALGSEDRLKTYDPIRLVDSSPRPGMGATRARRVPWGRRHSAARGLYLVVHLTTPGAALSARL